MLCILAHWSSLQPCFDRRHFTQIVCRKVPILSFSSPTGHLWSSPNSDDKNSYYFFFFLFNFKQSARNEAESGEVPLRFENEPSRSNQSARSQKVVIIPFVFEYIPNHNGQDPWKESSKDRQEGWCQEIKESRVILLLHLQGPEAGSP
jgi:hypothetical protein